MTQDCRTPRQTTPAEVGMWQSQGDGCVVILRFPSQPTTPTDPQIKTRDPAKDPLENKDHTPTKVGVWYYKTPNWSSQNDNPQWQPATHPNDLPNSEVHKPCHGTTHPPLVLLIPHPPALVDSTTHPPVGVWYY
ncbi:hypothetical protein BS47DRAFT_1358799 [Hydnum rufescens UP504]|uniref:Uncharacterized protein n=1 Tax=Hydnum rufescens UP504 TaxID=1448309 RepID=A0A9P6B6V9_9AGAM|nr:hypothetical protein BS47DRAFT_1358799 [Hydnum rufescens UP504]